MTPVIPGLTGDPPYLFLVLKKVGPGSWPG
jgi:hypothetical protein